MAKARKNNVNLVGVAVTVLGLPYIIVVTNDAARKAGVQAGDPVEKRMRAVNRTRSSAHRWSSDIPRSVETR